MKTTVLSIESITEYKINDLINLDVYDNFLDYLKDFDLLTENIKITIEKTPK